MKRLALLLAPVLACTLVIGCDQGSRISKSEFDRAQADSQKALADVGALDDRVKQLAAANDKLRDELKSLRQTVAALDKQGRTDLEKLQNALTGQSEQLQEVDSVLSTTSAKLEVAHAEAEATRTAQLARFAQQEAHRLQQLAAEAESKLSDANEHLAQITGGKVLPAAATSELPAEPARLSVESPSEAAPPEMPPQTDDQPVPVVPAPPQPENEKSATQPTEEPADKPTSKGTSPATDKPTKPEDKAETDDESSDAQPETTPSEKADDEDPEEAGVDKSEAPAEDIAEKPGTGEDDASTSENPADEESSDDEKPAVEKANETSE